MINIQDAISEGHEALRYKISSYQNESLILLQHAANKSKEFLIAHSDDQLDRHTYKRYQEYLQRRASGEPVAYITKTKEFWSLPLDIIPGVLIPRPETELIIEVTLEIITTKDKIRILDLGTGSGCIAIALASELPNAEITACDNSATCIELAKKNAKKFNLSNIDFILSNWFEHINENNFDLIVSNPPYIACNDPDIDFHVEQYEPQSALFSKNNGLYDIQQIIEHSTTHLKPGGTIVIEHGFKQAQAVRKIFADNHYESVTNLQDIQQMDRVTTGKMHK